MGTCALDSEEYSWWEDAVLDFGRHGTGGVDISVTSLRTGYMSTFIELDDYDRNDWNAESFSDIWTSLVIPVVELSAWMTKRRYSAKLTHCATKYDGVDQEEEKYHVVDQAEVVHEALAKPTDTSALDKRVKAALMSKSKRNGTPLSGAKPVKESFRGLSNVALDRVCSGRIRCGRDSTNVLRVGNKYLFEKHVLKSGLDDIKVEFLIEGEVINVAFKREHVRGVSAHPELMLLPAQGGRLAPLGKSMGYKMKAREEYVGPVTLVHCTSKHTKEVSSGQMAASGYTAMTKPGWCVSPVFATAGTTEWIGVHYLSKETVNSCILFTEEIIEELKSNDFTSRPRAELDVPSVEC